MITNFILKTVPRFTLSVTSLFTAHSINCFSQNIYGFVDRYFIAIDLDKNSCDTLIEFSGKPYINLEFFAAIDRFNGRYFFSGQLPGHTGNFHIIDLINLSITSSSFYTGDMEYDPFEEKIYYIKSGKFYSLSLSDMIPKSLSTVFTQNSRIFGQVRTYIAQKNEYMYITPTDSKVFIQGSSGKIECQRIHPTAETGYNTNLLTDEIYSVSYGNIIRTEPCGFSTTTIARIPDFKSHLNVQMTVFNHALELYIVPYVASDSKFKYALIDIKEGKFLKSIEQFPLTGIMDLQMIYDKPIAPVRIIGDTIFVPKGLAYYWYLNDSLICKTTSNYIIPRMNGTYKAKIDFREYASFSKEVDVDSITLAEFKFELMSNLVSNQLHAILNDCNYEKILIHDSQGKLVYDQSFDVEGNPYEQLINVGSFAQGLYIVSVLFEKQLYSNKFIKF